MPDGSERPQGAGYGSFGAARATDAIAAAAMKNFILKLELKVVLDGIYDWLKLQLTASTPMV